MFLFYAENIDYKTVFRLLDPIMYCYRSLLIILSVCGHMFSVLSQLCHVFIAFAHTGFLRVKVQLSDVFQDFTDRECVLYRLSLASIPFPYLLIIIHE